MPSTGTNSGMFIVTAILEIQKRTIWAGLFKFPIIFHNFMSWVLSSKAETALCGAGEKRIRRVAAGDLILFNPRDDNGNHYCAPINVEILDYR